MGDPTEKFQPTPSSFGKKGRVITAGAADIDPIPKAIVTTSAGDLTVVPLNNADAVTIPFTGVPVGFVPPFVVRRVTAATATLATIED